MGISIKNDRSQITPKNVILVGGLGVWLAYLVFGGTSPVSTTEAASAKVSTTASDVSASANQGGVERQRKMEAWDRLEFDLSKAIEHDPFSRLDEPKSPDTSPAHLANSDTTPETEDEEAAKQEAARLELESKQRIEQQIASRIAALKNQKIDAVYESGGKATALIGSKRYTEGDLLTAGVRVVRITPSGMTVTLETADKSKLDVDADQ